MNNRLFKVFATLADLHIGKKIINAYELKQQLNKHFIKPLKDFVYLDGIFIPGDILDAIVSMNSEYAELFNWFINKVYKIAKVKGAVVIIIKGTRSHDNDQLMNIKHLQNNDDNVDFRIYETIEEITIWDNYKILVLPDIKVKDPTEIDKLLEKKYDIILGHGTIDSMQFFVQESENIANKTYVFDVDKLMAASRGPILFGHIHTYQNIRDKFYYVGSFSVLERGVPDAGWMVGAILNKDHTKYHMERVINTDAASFYEFSIGKTVLENFTIEEIMQAIDDELEDSKPNDLVTLRITRGDGLDAADKVIMLETRYRNDDRFSIIKKIKTSKEEATEAENNERKNKYAYVLDGHLSIQTIMHRYYESDIKPNLSDKYTRVANLTEADFAKMLNLKDV